MVVGNVWFFERWFCGVVPDEGCHWNGTKNRLSLLGKIEPVHVKANSQAVNFEWFDYTYWRYLEWEWLNQQVQYDCKDNKNRKYIRTKRINHAWRIRWVKGAALSDDSQAVIITWHLNSTSSRKGKINISCRELIPIGCHYVLTIKWKSGDLFALKSVTLLQTKGWNRYSIVDLWIWKIKL